MRKCSKVLVLLLGFLETILFSGVIFGWADIVYVFKKERVYECQKDGNGTATEIVCDHQDNMFNIAFTIGATTTGASGLVTAWILDHLGIKLSRLIANLFLIIGGLFLALTSDWNHALLPGTFFIGFGGGQTFRNNILIANLFPRRRSTVIALYSGAFLASASAVLGLKYAYDNDFRFRNCLLTWTAGSLMMLVTTVCLPTPLLPKARRTRRLDKSQKDTYHLLPVRMEDENSSDQDSDLEKDKDAHIKKPLSFVKTACSCAFMVHMFWMCVMNLLMLEYSGSFNRWLHQASSHLNIPSLLGVNESFANSSFEMKLGEIANTESWISTLYGFCQIPMLVVAPLAGILMDYSLRKAHSDPDPAKLQSKSKQSGFSVLITTTFLALLLNICFFYPHNLSIKISLFLFIIVRSFSYAVGFSFIRSRFPPELFNRLTGLMTTMMATVGLLQVPLFMTSTTYPQLVHSLMAGAVVLSFTNPFLLLFSV